MRHSFLRLYCVILVVLFCPKQAVWGAELDWWTLDHGVTNDLMDGQDLVTTVREIAGQPVASDPGEIVRNLDFALRAGLKQEALRQIDGLAAHRAELPAELPNHLLGALEQRQEYDLMLRLAERFPGITSNLITQATRRWGEAGATPAEMDQWMKARYNAAPSAFWLECRARLAVAQGTSATLLAELEKDVRAHPADFARTRNVLQAVSYVPGPKPDLNWIGETFKTEDPREDAELAWRLKVIKNWRGAALLYERALVRPLTDAQTRSIAMMTQAYRSPDQVRAQFVQGVRKGLLDCYQNLGKKQKAQQLAEQLMNVSSGEGISLDDLLATRAGAAQAASGQRVIEDAIQAQEPASQNDPEYWLTRAGYYVGREEQTPALAAYAKALELAPIVVRKPGVKQSSGIRAQVLSRHGQYLISIGRIDDARGLYRRELADRRPDAESVATAASGLLELDGEDQARLDPNDEVLWSYLAHHDEWTYPASGLFEAMARRLPEGRPGNFWTRAENLAHAGGATRAGVAGASLLAFGDAERAIPLLNRAVTEHVDSADRRLFEAYLRMDDWRHAEALFPQARRNLTSQETVERLARMAAVAAAKGDRADALRLYRQAANLDLTNLRHLAGVRDAELRSGLREYYQWVRTELPASRVPDRALAALD